MKIFLKKLLYLIILTFGVFNFSNLALAFGQLTEPIVIGNALRNQIIVEEMMLVNNKDESIVAQLRTSGDIAEWVEYFYISDLENPIQEVFIATSSNLNIIAKITVASGTPNGDYEGSLDVILDFTKNDMSTSTYASIAQVVERNVSISVTDIEDLKLDVSITPNKYDFVSGEKLNFRISYFNEGNILLKPNVQVKILKEDEVFFNRIFPYNENDEGVEPLSNKIVTVEGISFDGLDFKKYNVVVSVLVNDLLLKEEPIDISYSELVIVKGAVMPVVSGETSLLSSFLMLLTFILILAIVAYTLYKLYTIKNIKG